MGQGQVLGDRVGDGQAVESGSLGGGDAVGRVFNGSVSSGRAFRAWIAAR